VRDPRSLPVNPRSTMSGACPRVDRPASDRKARFSGWSEPVAKSKRLVKVCGACTSATERARARDVRRI